MLGVRVGIHTGSAVRRGDDWFGSAVNLAARVADTARAGEVLVTEPTRQELGRGVRLCPRGRQRFKNVAQWLNVYALVLDNPPPALPIDPVCHMAVDPARAFAHEVVDGIDYFLCSAACASAFAADPSAYPVGG
jgi:adenylate cyclase